MSTNFNSPISVETPVNVYNSINFLPPYLQKQPLMQDLCFFIDYLQVDIESAYNDLRYKYIDWSKISQEGAIQTLSGMGMDYIIDLIQVITPSNSTQLLALCSVIWLLKGQLLGVDIIASICGFTYTYTVWHEQVPLGEPNTATINIDFVKYRALSQDFQHNFVEFLRKYLYPVVEAHVDIAPMIDELGIYGVLTYQKRYSFTEIARYTGQPINYNIMPYLLNKQSQKSGCSITPNGQALTTNVIQNWIYPIQLGLYTGYLNSSNLQVGSIIYKDSTLKVGSIYGVVSELTDTTIVVKSGESIIYSGNYEVDGVWNTEGYYAISGYWGAKAVQGAFAVESITAHDTGGVYIYQVTPITSFNSGSPEQNMRVFISYSDNGATFSNWEDITTGKLVAFRYCRFRIEFNNTASTQMTLYSFDITLS